MLGEALCFKNGLLKCNWCRYIYQYYSSDGRDHRRQYALYAPPFGICMVLMGMCVIFYKRFQLKAQEANIAGAEKVGLTES